MKRIFSFRNLIMGFIAIIFFSACSKEVSFPNTSATISSSSTTTSPQNAIYVNANNWVKVSEREYRCTFYGLMAYPNQYPTVIRIYVADSNQEIIISNGSKHFMDGELTAGHDNFNIWANFKAATDIQNLPFSSLKLKIVFE